MSISSLYIQREDGVRGGTGETNVPTYISRCREARGAGRKMNATPTHPMDVPT